MDKNDYSQLELFSQEARALPVRQGMPSSLRSYLKVYEKVVLGTIALLIIAIASFSLGVEKGKRLNAAPVLQGAVAEVASLKPALLPTPRTLGEPAEQPAQRAQLTQKSQMAQKLPVAQAATAGAQPYTIQIASFTEKTYAKKEAEALKNRGFAVTLIPKGKYMILCVGPYSNKNNAQVQLAKLKKQYQGCFIRRL